MVTKITKITAILLLCSIGVFAQVPNTDNFSLQDVIDEIYGTIFPDQNLVDAFNDANPDGFDDDYKGNKDRLYNFRNYHDKVYEGYSLAQQFTFNITDARYYLGITMKPDGSKLYIIYLKSGGEVRFRQYNLGTAWDISTLDFNYDSGISSTSYPGGISIQQNTGKKFYVASNSDGGGAGEAVIYQYDLSTAWDLGTFAYETQENIGSYTDNGINDIEFTDDGNYFQISDDYGIDEYTMSVQYMVYSAQHRLETSSLNSETYGVSWIEAYRFVESSPVDGIVQERNTPYAWHLHESWSSGSDLLTGLSNFGNTMYTDRDGVYIMLLSHSGVLYKYEAN